MRARAPLRLAAGALLALACLGHAGAGDQPARPFHYVVLVSVELVSHPDELAAVHRELGRALTPPFRRAVRFNFVSDPARPERLCPRAAPCDVLELREGPMPGNPERIAVLYRWRQVAGTPRAHEPMNWAMLDCDLSSRRVGDYRKCRRLVFPDVIAALQEHDDQYHD